MMNSLDMVRILFRIVEGNARIRGGTKNRTPKTQESQHAVEGFERLQQTLATDQGVQIKFVALNAMT